MEAIQQFRPNIVGLQLVTRERKWYIIGCYLAPNDTLMIESVVAALKERPWGAKLLVVGYLNISMEEPEGYRREEEIAAALTMAGIEDMSAHFLPRRHPWCRDERTWSMFRAGREVRSWMDYILGTDHCLFRNVAARYPWHNSDHHLVLGCLCRAPTREQTDYSRIRTRPPLRPLTTPTKEGTLFAALRRAVLKPKSWETRKNA